MDGILDIYTILFLVLAVVIFLRLRSVLGRRTGNERQPFDPYTRTESPNAESSSSARDKIVPLPRKHDSNRNAPDAETPAGQNRWAGFAKQGSALAKTFNAFAEIDPRFDPREFLEGAKTAYEMIVTAFAAGDSKTLQPLLGKEVHDGFATAIDERARRGETIESTFIGIEKTEIVDAALKGTAAQVTVKFVSELISVTRNKAGEVIDGDEKAIQDVTDIWTFARDLSSSNPNWKLVATEAAG